MTSRESLLQADLRHLPKTVSLLDAEVQGIATAHDQSVLPDSYDPAISQPDLGLLLNRAEHPLDVIRPWLVYAGAHAENDQARQLFLAKPETVAIEGLFHATVSLNGTRTSVRYTPNEWGKDATPFTLSKTHTGARVVHSQDAQPPLPAIEGKILEPEATCLKNLTYKSDGTTRAVDQSITINPIQSCPMRCKFCRRQYDEYDAYKKSFKDLGLQPIDRLTNLRPDEIAAHVIEKYPEIEWGSNNQIAIVTGTFANFSHMYQYIAEFVDSMAKNTNGQFDPRVHSLQNIHILTHLARTREEMIALQEIGVKTVQDTTEIIDDETRKNLMPKANPKNARLLGKGELVFDQILDSVRNGISVFGSSNYFLTLILGLDSYSTTLRGMNQLKEAGLQHLDAPIYQPFEAKGISLYRMTARELGEVALKAKGEFKIVSTHWNPTNLITL